MNTGIVILAAGRGSRLGMAQPKPLVPLQGIPMIQRILDILPSDIPYHIIISPKDKQIFEETLGPQPYLFQPSAKGTADAINSQYTALKKYDHIIVLNGDTPLIQQSLITTLIQSSQEDIIVGFKTQDPQAYGQIIAYNNIATQIVEAKDRTEHLSNLCFSGIMKLSQASRKKLIGISPSPITQEYYITHIVSQASPFHLLLTEQKYLDGINTFSELQRAENTLKAITLEKLLQHNITTDDYQSIVLYQNQLQAYTHISAQASIKHSKVGKYCRIGQGAVLENVTLEDNVTILPYSVLSHCHIKENSTIGPFAHICENSSIGPNAHIGNFVEVKRTIIKANVKAKHLSYLGDAYIDEHANIGAGTITCNYVPWKKGKSLTYIGPYAFIGANTLLIAPIHIGPYALCAAGTVINKDLLPKSSALSRSPLSTRFRRST